MAACQSPRRSAIEPCRKSRSSMSPSPGLTPSSRNSALSSSPLVQRHAGGFDQQFCRNLRGLPLLARPADSGTPAMIIRVAQSASGQTVFGVPRWSWRPIFSGQTAMAGRTGNTKRCGVEQLSGPYRPESTVALRGHGPNKKRRPIRCRTEAPWLLSGSVNDKIRCLSWHRRRHRGRRRPPCPQTRSRRHRRLPPPGGRRTHPRIEPVNLPSNSPKPPVLGQAGHRAHPCR